MTANLSAQSASMHFFIDYKILALAEKDWTNQGKAMCALRRPSLQPPLCQQEAQLCTALLPMQTKL